MDPRECRQAPSLITNLTLTLNITVALYIKDFATEAEHTAEIKTQEG